MIKEISLENEIEAHRKAICDADAKLYECSDIEHGYIEAFEQCTDQLIRIGQESDMRRQALLSLQQQHDLAHKQYIDAQKYAALMKGTHGSDQAVEKLSQAQQHLFDCEHLYRRAQADCDQEDARAILKKEELSIRCGALTTELAENETRRIDLKHGRMLAVEELGKLLYQQACQALDTDREHVENAQVSLQDNQALLKSDLQYHQDQLSEYHDLQRQLCEEYWQDDLLAQLISSCVTLLENYLQLADSDSPVVRSLTGQRTLQNLLASQQLSIESMVLQAVNGETQVVQKLIEYLGGFLEGYRRTLKHE